MQPDPTPAAAPAMRHERHFGSRVVRCFADRPATVGALFDAALADGPAREALVADGQRLDYATLSARADAAAAGLAALGVAAGDRVALLLVNRAEFVVAFLALLRLGAIAVPLGTRLQGPEVAWIVEHCGAVALIHEADLTARVPGPEAAPRLRRVIAVADDGAPVGETAGAAASPDPRALDWAAMLAAGAGHAAGRAPATEEDVALILYTSGTTGRPKGAMLTHLNVVHSAMHFVHGLGLQPGERAVLAVPASHVTGIVAVVVTLWAAGGCTVTMREFRAAAFLALAARERLSYTILVPAMYALCLLEPGFDAHDLSHWRVGGYGGAPMPPATIAALAARLPGLGLVNAYGATETTSPTTLLPARLAASHADSVGQVVACGHVLVMDAAGREVPPGSPGELWIAGPMVVPGYWDNPEATREAFVHGYWRSGDVGSVDADGFVRVFDRVKDMLNRGGYKIYSVEVEAVLAQHPGVLESAVVGRPCPVLGERVHAFVSRRDPAVCAEQLRAHCAANLADYKVPETWTLTDEPLPRNANGKLLKRALRERLAAG